VTDRESEPLKSGPQSLISAADDHAVYVFGLKITGMPGLPASPEPPRAGLPRAIAVRFVPKDEIDARWKPQRGRRLVDRRWPDGRLVLAVDEDPQVGFRIDAPEFGVHLASADGTEVLLRAHEGPDWVWQRLLFAQTLPIAATLQGLALFHASAVRIEGHAVAVTAPSGTGKSSTAAHLVAQGAEFFTDDVLALDLVAGELLAFAGPQFANVEEHEVRAVEPTRRQNLGRLLGRSSSQQHLRPPISQTSLPLGALYLLERDDEVNEIYVDELDGSGIATLLASAFIPHLSTEGRLARHLELCGRMATSGHVCRLRAPLRGSAAAVAAAVMDDAQRRLRDRG
jgi:hypothetical protein